MKLHVKQWVMCIALLVFLGTALPVQAASGSSIKASIPSFPVHINGQELDASYSNYPFLYYKDITYLPMTWNVLQALGIEMQWSEEEGLQVWTNRNFPRTIHDAMLEQELNEKRNAALNYSVQVADWPITINQTVIDNGREPYPFLTFREVTYMPLTWNFVHDLLQLDIRWSTEDGLHLIGNQNVISSLIGEDDQALYFYSQLGADPAKAMLRMDKSMNTVEWRGREDQEKLLHELSSYANPYAGKPVELQRKGRELYYGNLLLYTLSDADVWESNMWGAPVHTYTQYDAGNHAVIISINLTMQIAVIGPNYGTTYTFLVRDGKVTELKDFNQRLHRVIPNPDGTAWIASSRLPSRSAYIGGSARVALLDRDGNVHLVNELLNEADVLALGLTNPVLMNPAGPDGSLYVVLFGRNKTDFSPQDSAGLYVLNTRLQTVRLSNQVSGEYYLDKNRAIYIQHHNNTIENQATGEIRTWFDRELAHMK